MCDNETMKIAYLHRLSFDETEKRFAEEADKHGITLVPIKYKQLRLSGDKIYFKETDLAEFDGWYFRAVGSELEWAKLLEIYAKRHYIPVVDEYLLTHGPLRRFKSVMGFQLIEAGVNYPKSAFVESLVDLETEISNWQFPLIIKLSQGGRHGMGTFFLKTKEEYKEFLEKLEERKRIAIQEGKQQPSYRGFLIQEYIPNDGDFRLMTVGYKSVGGFKRAPKEEKMVLNKSIAKSSRLEVLPEDVIEEAEKAARVLGVEVAGTDLVRDSRNGKVYVIEVNEAPQFKVFEKRTGTNAAGEIMNYLINKFNK